MLQDRMDKMSSTNLTLRVDIRRVSSKNELLQTRVDGLSLQNAALRARINQTSLDNEVSKTKLRPLLEWHAAQRLARERLRAQGSLNDYPSLAVIPASQRQEAKGSRESTMDGFFLGLSWDCR